VELRADCVLQYCLMKKILQIVVLSLFLCNISYSDIKSDTKVNVLKAQECYFSLPSYAQEGVIDSWLDTKQYWNDAVKEQNMGDPRNLASSFYRNANTYAGVVLRIGSAYGSQVCRP